jgi:hypothetical protein
MEETIIESQCVLLGLVERIWCVNRESGEHDILCCPNGPFLQVNNKYVDLSVLCAERINNYVDVALFYVLHIIFW